MPIEDILKEDESPEIKESDTAVFTCPNCKKISQDDVIFRCNNCDSTELVYKEGLYICPNCLKPGENFECINCGSKKVKMSFKKPAKRKNPSK